MPRLREIPRDEVTAPVVTRMYDFLFGERDPAKIPALVESFYRAHAKVAA